MWGDDPFDPPTPKRHRREAQGCCSALPGCDCLTVCGVQWVGVSGAVASMNYSTCELLAAASALQAGAFSERSAADEMQGPLPVLAPLVRLWAGCAGAGASTVALTLADAADEQRRKVRLLDAASPTWSGLRGCPGRELGSDSGWRRGRRGASLHIDRWDTYAASPSEVAVPRADIDADLTVLDVGWSVREMLGDLGSRETTWISSVAADAEIVVTRSDDVALCQTELALGALAEADSASAATTMVVVVSPTHSTRVVAGAAGPRIRDLLVTNRVWFAPALPGRVSLGPDPLPRRLRTFGHRLLDEAIQNERTER